MDPIEDLDVLVVGAGFGGLHQLYNLRKLGYKVKALEAAGGLGGIWYWQTYPGARVDSEVPIYQFSDEGLWKGWNYTERFPARAEIIEYFKYVEQKWDVSKDIYFNTRVVSAEFNTSTNKWRVTADGGQVFTARFLDLCVGMAAKTYEAQFSGMEDFQGVIHHSNNWPHEVDLQGKRVAVIGTGATGVQLVQTLGPKVGHLTVFQRTPNLALPMRNPKLTKDEQAADKEKYPELFDIRFKTNGGTQYTRIPKKAVEESAEARQALYEQNWAHGDFHFWTHVYSDSYIDETANAELYDFWRKKVWARVHSPVMQEKLAPQKAPHAFGTKRPSLEMTYFEVYNQPNVELVTLKTNPIERFTATGIRTTDGVDHELDCVVMATGFDAVSGSLHRIDIKGSAGISLKEKWETNGIRTFLGMTTSGFPNMFFLYNAQAPTAFSNGPSCIEAQGDWVIKCIEHVTKSGKTSIDATEKAEETFSENNTKRYNSTLFSKTESWYNGANIPGKKQESMNYIGGIPLYLQECNASSENGYEGFVIR